MTSSRSPKSPRVGRDASSRGAQPKLNAPYDSTTKFKPFLLKAAVPRDTIFTLAKGAPALGTSEVCTREKLNREFALYGAVGGCGQPLDLSRKILEAVPLTSVEPESNFSIVRLLLGENRV